MRDVLFMVWLEGGRAPSACHATRDEAKDEAERVCKKEGKPCYVLRAESVCYRKEQPIEWQKL